MYNRKEVKHEHAGMILDEFFRLKYINEILDKNKKVKLNKLDSDNNNN